MRSKKLYRQATGEGEPRLVWQENKNTDTCVKSKSFSQFQKLRGPKLRREKKKLQGQSEFPSQWSLEMKRAGK